MSEAGLYVAGTRRIHPDAIAFTPQYPLWTDGLHKRRWLVLPAGTAIDASDPDVWAFPAGTRLFKEFGTADRPLETRMSERLPDGSWRFVSYVWNADGSDAELAPEDGVAIATPGLTQAHHLVPARADCLACHDAGLGPVLGVTALQLSPAEASTNIDADLRTLVARGVVRGLPRAMLDTPPRIDATTRSARAALGYLHGNCGHCHNDTGPLASLDLALAQKASAPQESAHRTLVSLLGQTSRFRPRDSTAAARVVPGSPASSVLALRMRSTHSFTRMPPLGVQVVDTEGVARIEDWIRHDLAASTP